MGVVALRASGKAASLSSMMCSIDLRVFLPLVMSTEKSLFRAELFRALPPRTTTVWFVLADERRILRGLAAVLNWLLLCRTCRPRSAANLLPLGRIYEATYQTRQAEKGCLLSVI